MHLTHAVMSPVRHGGAHKISVSGGERATGRVAKTAERRVVSGEGVLVEICSPHPTLRHFFDFFASVDGQCPATRFVKFFLPRNGVFFDSWVQI